MCGCMLMHAMMNHEEHQHSSESKKATSSNQMPAAASEAKCSHCGFPLGQGFAFCPNCGMSLKTMNCPACGQKADPTWSACAYCGSPLGKVERQQAQS
jgi:predicted amidophosphoribosyltransferase